MGKIVAVVNQKGGTGKTTTVFNLGAALALKRKRRVLLLDLDPQGSLTLFSGALPEDFALHLSSVLEKPDRFGEALVGIPSCGVQLLPVHPEITNHLEKPALRKTWRANLGKLLNRAASDFHFVLIDCPPSLGPITRQAFRNAHSVLVPLQCEYLALRGLQLLIRTIDRIREEANPNLKILGVLPTMFDKRTLHSREVLDQTRAALAGRVPILPMVVGKTVRFPESAVSALPIFKYDPRNPASRAYIQLAKEIDTHG